jgi:hypothetical protein
VSFTPSEVILGATVPLENGSTVTFSIAGHVEAERDYDDAVVIFGRKLLKYTNCATDADRLTVRQVVASITSTPLDKVPDVGTPTPPAPAVGPAPTVAEQAAAAVARVVKPPAPAETPAAEDVCERCGGAVPKSQAKLSMLFMNKTLCKKCQAEAP